MHTYRLQNVEFLVTLYFRRAHAVGHRQMQDKRERSETWIVVVWPVFQDIEVEEETLGVSVSKLSNQSTLPILALSLRSGCWSLARNYGRQAPSAR